MEDSMLALKVQYYNFRAEHGTFAASWMLDAKVLGAAQELYHYFQERGIEKFVDLCNNATSPLMICAEAYHILVNRKAITPIKELGNQRELQELVISLFPVTSDIKLYVRRIKTIYFLTCLPVTINLKKDDEKFGNDCNNVLPLLTSNQINENESTQS